MIPQNFFVRLLRSFIRSFIGRFIPTLSPFGVSLGIIVPDNRQEIYEFLSRNGWVDDIGKLPDIGVFVAEVVEKSSAQKVGFQEGDIILKVEGQIGMNALNLIERTFIEMTSFREFSEVEVLRQNHTEVIEIKSRL
jgi:S1-C subfamily serine protease